MKKFQYLKRGPKNTNAHSSEILIENITKEQIVSGFITKDINCYKYYPSYCDYKKANSGFEHEVIFGWQPQRIKFDIDYKVVNLPETKNTDIYDILNGNYEPPFIDIAMNKIIDSICNCLFYLYQLYVSSEDLIIIDSSGVISEQLYKYKYSYGIIISDYLVENNEEAKYFTSKVVENLPPDIAVCIDQSVNKSIQNFRLIGQSKPDGRTKIMVPGLYNSKKNSKEEETIICPRTKIRILPLKRTEATRQKVNLTLLDENIAEILKLDCVLERIVDFTYRTNYGNLLVFDRKNPSQCKLCNEIHHKDNTLMLSIADNGTIFEKCRHAPNKTIKIGEYSKFHEIHSQLHTNDKKESKTTRNEKESKTIQDNGKEENSGLWFPELIRGLSKHIDLTERNLRNSGCNIDVYSEPTMKNYPLTRTLFVRAQMKLGKTKALRQYMETYFQPVTNPIIRIVTFRQTFSNSIKSSFPDFTLYNSLTGMINQTRNPRLIIQVESLHRLEMYAGIAPIQLLVLDEVESILDQFNSGLHKKFSASFAIFEWMVRTAQHLVCMDANLGSRTLEIIKRLRGNDSALIHLNTFKRAAEDTFQFTLSKGVLFSKMIEYVQAGKKIVIATNSLTDAKTIHHDLASRFKGSRKIMLYSSKTSPSEKRTHFSDVATHWKALDILIYTPTVSAGISFELEHFDALFALFGDKSCSVEVCRQMLLRVRNLREKMYYVYLNGTFKNLPSDIDDIKKGVLSSRQNLYNLDMPIPFSYDENGKVFGINEDLIYFRLWLENTRMRNLSRNNFIRRFITQVHETGASIRIMNADDASKSLCEFKSAKRAMISIANEEIANAKNINSEEAADIVREISTDNAVDISRDKLLSYEKFKISETFRWKNINAEFVENYNHKHVKSIYYNLQKIHNAKNVHEAIESIRQKEIDHRDVIWTLHTQDVALHKDIQYKYTTSKHKIAIMLLEACGFRCLTDKLIIYDKALLINLESFQLTLYAQTLYNDFEISASLSLQKAVDRLKIVNFILRNMYGIEIYKTAKCNYQLRNTNIGNLFEIVSQGDEEKETDKPKIVSKLILDTTPELDLILNVIYSRFYSDYDE